VQVDVPVLLTRYTFTTARYCVEMRRAHAQELLNRPGRRRRRHHQSADSHVGSTIFTNY